ncbi:MAG: hypothetical protein ACPGJV_05790 [Bacteriovoracaceae bacterium]
MTMEVTITCKECGSGVHVHPSTSATDAHCEVCGHDTPIKFNQDHLSGKLCECPVCERKDFYSQKDFNRKIGVILFVIAAILSIWTYGISFIVLYLFDLILYKKLGKIGICYNCQTIFRNISNIDSIPSFDHEMNDRIIYSGHDFDGKPLEH